MNMVLLIKYNHSIQLPVSDYFKHDSFRRFSMLFAKCIEWT